MRPNLEYFVPVKNPSRLAIMCRATLRGLRWSVTRVGVVARSDRTRRILDSRMPRWFSRRAATITWVVLATLGLTPILFSSLLDGEVDAVGKAGSPELVERQDVPAVPADHVDAVDHPTVIHVDAGSIEQLCTVADKELVRIAERTSYRILPDVRRKADELVVLQLRDVPLSFSSLPPSDRRALARRYGHLAGMHYEMSVARFLDTLVHEIQAAQPGALLSVLGLPVEPAQVGVSVEVARESNERYAPIIDRLDTFVTGRGFIVAGGGADEDRLARRAFQESIRLRDGRPILFQTNLAWRVITDADGVAYEDYRIAGSTGSGLQIEASLSD